MNYGLSETNCIAHQISLISCRRSEFLISFFGNFVGHTFSSQELYSHSTFWKNFPDQHNRGISLFLKKPKSTQNLNHFPPVTQYLRLTLSIYFDCKDQTYLRISWVRAHSHRPEQKKVFKGNSITIIIWVLPVFGGDVFLHLLNEKLSCFLAVQDSSISDIVCLSVWAN